MTGKPQVTKGNPLIDSEGIPEFDQIRPEHVEPAVNEMLKRCKSTLAELEAVSSHSWNELFAGLNKISLLIHSTWAPVSHLNGVLNSEPLREVYEKVQGDVVKICLEINQSKKLFAVMKQIEGSAQQTNLSPVQLRILKGRIQDAELAGIGLNGAEREEFNNLSQDLTRLSTDFANNVLDATKQYRLVLRSKDEIKGLSESFLAMAAQSYNSQKKEDEELSSAKGGPWLVTLDHPSFAPFMENSQRRDLREKIYRAFIGRAAKEPFDNRDTIKKILQIRKRQATLLGFSTYADLSLSRKMAGSVDEITSLEEELRICSWDTAKQELQDLKDLASGSAEPELMNWDTAFWAKRLQEKRFQFTDDDIRPYFALPRVLNGLFALVAKLFDVEVKPQEGDVPKWHKDVQYFKIFDREGNALAGFFLDPYSRPENKRGGAWMDECLTRHRKLGELILPVAYLVCNSTPPIDDAPSLMTFREVETLFHEFGHGLQHMLTKVDYLDVSGINGVEWDAVELPSQFMENWCYHKPTLMGMARHFQSGERMPDELFDKLVAAKTFRAGQMMLRQIQFGTLDLTLHHTYDPDSEISPFAVQKEIAKRTSVMQPLEDDYFLCSFTHIFSGGYAAGYYSYKWAEVLSADAYSAFEDVGLDNERAIAEVGQRFKDTILALGGSQHPLEIFKAFRGRVPNSKALLRHCGLSS